MAYFSSSKALSAEYCSTADSESGWTDYIGDRTDDGTESDDSLTSDARSSPPPPPASRRFHRYNQHSDDDQIQHKLRGQATSSVTKKMQQFQKLVTDKSMKHPCNNVANFNKQAIHDDDDRDEEDGEQLMRYQQSWRTTVGSTTDA